ncbi:MULTISPECIES: hypothetical protein [Streptomyces]|uniref:hypothetical protein n=1 Tax=Streptomyces TaxID=1883 RepID=UPI000B9EBEA9|nr:hypothetical protein [Streptomyces kasugaensis]
MPPAALHYVRFQSTTRHPHGHFPGVFALVNTLAKEGRLTPGQERFRRTNNDWYDANYPNPSDTDPTVYDRTLNPGAVAWFKSTSHDLIARVDGYLAILAAHHIPCHRLHSATPPGRIVYEDTHQIVVTPHPTRPTATTGATAVGETTEAADTE